MLAADELGRAGLVQDLVELRPAPCDLALVGLGPLALLGHGLVEAGLVDLDALLGHDLLGHLEREAVGVVELEGHVARQGLARFQLVQRGVEDRRARAQGLPEAVSSRSMVWRTTAWLSTSSG